MSILLAASAVILSVSWSGADPRAGVGSLKNWTTLKLGAQKALIFSATTTLVLSQGKHSGTGRPAVVFKTRSQARVLGATGFEEETTSYIDRDRHRPIEFFQLRPGDSARRYLFLDGLVRQTNWEPPAGGSNTEFKDWREVETIDRRLTYADGTAPAPEEWVTDFYSLIYLLRNMDLTAAPPVPKGFTTLYRRHLVRIRVTAGERRRNEREVINEATGAAETLRLRERRIRLKPLGEGAESFRGLMGMQGDTEVWIDEDSGALLEIDGDAPGVGATQVLLTSFRR